MVCGDGGVGQVATQAHLSAHTFTICSLKELKSRPGIGKTILRHFFSELSNLTPAFLHQILLAQ